jgi:hypothetical protein
MSGIHRFLTRRDRNHKLNKQSKEEVHADERLDDVETYRLIFGLLRHHIYSHGCCVKDFSGRILHQKIIRTMRRRYSLGASRSACTCLICTPNIDQRPHPTNQTARNHRVGGGAYQLCIAGHTRGYRESIQPAASTRRLYRRHHQNLHAQHQAPGRGESPGRHMLSGCIVVRHVRPS